MEKTILTPDNVQLFIKEQGAGTILVFIPGWLMTTRCFENQFVPLSSQYHIVSYDPRCQGNSSINFNHNHNEQRGKDLHSVLQHFKNKKVCLLGWSDGYFAICSYVRQFGMDKIAAVVNIDRPPCGVALNDNDYAFGTFADEKEVYLNILHHQKSYLKKFVKSLFNQPIPSAELKFFEEDCLKTPPIIAAQLIADNLFHDYSGETKQLAAQIPYLHIVAKEREEEAKQWCKSNIPQAEIVAFGGHMMFWEEAERFNQCVQNFLQEKL